VRGWRWRAVGWDAAAILLIPVGVALFSAYCWVYLDNPLAFSQAQDLWGRRFAAPWTGFGQAAAMVAAHPLLHAVAVHNLFDVVSAIVVVTLLVLGFTGPWRLGTQHLYLLVYGAASVLLVLTGPVGGLFPIQGVARYAVEVVAIFLVLARLTAGRVGERLYLLPAIAVQTILVLTFLNNVWVG
jgi:hypothetical protein